MADVFRISVSRRAGVERRSGFRRSALYAAIKQGLWPQPIKIGARASAWVDSETDAVLAARIAGRSDDEIRDLVKKLEAQRKSIASRMLVTDEADA